MTAINPHIGFIQGRLSPLVNGKIQAFPSDHWPWEFPLAQAIGLMSMEWTLDHEGLLENPYCTMQGQEKIKTLCDKHHIAIPSVTGDCFMQSPFWKSNQVELVDRINEFKMVMQASRELGVSFVVIPLVDHGSIENEEQAHLFHEVLENFFEDTASTMSKVLFESNYGPQELARFMERFPSAWAGVNYDMGNSAALGFNPNEECQTYGKRICNVHVKDRPFNGSTVPLGRGDVDFPKTFQALHNCGYQGNYILQTARDDKGNHASILKRFAIMTDQWIRGVE